MRISDWSSDVCSSDLAIGIPISRQSISASASRWAWMPSASASRCACRRSGPAVRQTSEKPRRAAKTARRSEEHTSELQSLMRISYAVFCLKKKNKQNYTHLIETHYNTSVDTQVKTEV